MPILVLEIVLNELLSVLLKGLAPVKIAHLLTTKHENLGITATVDNSNRILVGLGAINHETLELWQWYTMSSHDVIEILLEDNLCVLVLELKIIACNGHDTLICSIINMTSHCGPIGNMFDVIEHDPGMLKISARSHFSEYMLNC